LRPAAEGGAEVDGVLRFDHDVADGEGLKSLLKGDLKAGRFESILKGG
jgi:hypothetical protein